jgi:ABC-2 type transport system permease protein
MNKFLWLVRRELWEARVIWIAPLICAVIIVGGTLGASAFSHGIDVGGMNPEDLAKFNDVLQANKIETMIAVMLGGLLAPLYLVLAFTQFFYAADALYGERRDRSILFFKSLPVSDFETVLSKLAIASVVMPGAIVLAGFASQIGVCAIVTAKFGSFPALAGHLWSPGVWGDVLVLDGYVLLADVLWSLPVVGYLLLVSAWARRAPVGLAVLIPGGVILAEWIVLHTGHVGRGVVGRLFGLFGLAFEGGGNAKGLGFAFNPDKLVGPTQTVRAVLLRTEFLISPELLSGVVIGAALIAASVYVRRYRDATI